MNNRKIHTYPHYPPKRKTNECPKKNPTILKKGIRLLIKISLKVTPSSFQGTFVRKTPEKSWSRSLGVQGGKTPPQHLRRDDHLTNPCGFFSGVAMGVVISALCLNGLKKTQVVKGKTQRNAGSKVRVFKDRLQSP